MAEITCKELVEWVTDYLDEALSEAERARVESHLGACRGCQHYLEQMRTVICLTGTLSEPSLPPDVKAKLLDAFRSWKQTS